MPPTHNRAIPIRPMLPLLFFAVTLAAGCQHGANNISSNSSDTGLQPKTMSTPGLDLKRGDIICSLGTENQLQTIYFRYDSAALDSSALSSLNVNARIMKELAGITIQIAGHCDERGTQEYNLALGDLRAQRVRDHLLHLGIPANQLATISYGEESPADPRHQASAWAKNRRCEFEPSDNL